MVLIGSIGFFVICQIANGIMNIMAARFVRRQAVLNAKLREEEARANFEQMEAINIKFEELMIRMEQVTNQKPRVIRGKYKPRRPKGIEHKDSHE
jgi:hypothetical protein